MKRQIRKRIKKQPIVNSSCTNDTFENWNLKCFGLGQIVEHVLGNRCVQRCVQLFPVGYQFVESPGFNAGPAQRMRPDFAGLLDQRHFKLFAVLVRQLLQSNGGRQASWTAADNDHVRLFGNPVHRHVLPSRILVARMDRVVGGDFRRNLRTAVS